MKRRYVFLVTALAAAITLYGCGSKSEEASSDIPDITVEAEEIPEKTEEDTAPAEEIYTENDEAPGEGYVRSSLTNQWVKEEVANARPIAVMMPTDSVAQPQYNIGSAGVLYEALEEGGISRQMAIIEGWQDMEKIGNIRSIRSYYVWLGMEWDSILVHFGGPYHAQTAITSTGVDYITGTTVGQENTSNQHVAGNAFFRSNDKSAPHNAYTSADLLKKSISTLGYETEHRSQYWNPNHFTFAAPSAPNILESYSDAKSAKVIDLKNIFPYTASRLEYNEEEGVYYKWLLNTKQYDAATDNQEQLTFSNVIIQMAEMEVLDAKGYLDFTITGTGKGYYCTKGRMIPITWTKTSTTSPTKYYDADGNEITLNTGKTYIAISPTDKEPVFE